MHKYGVSLQLTGFIGEGRFVLGKDSDNSARDFAIEAARIAHGLHCSDIVVLDLREKSPATDFFVIATGTSDRQMRTVCDEISQMARNRQFQRFGRAGYNQGQWILLDFVDVVAHVFDEKHREYYALELLWGDAEKVDWRDGMAESGIEELQQ